jgi:hypothetical protein
MCSIHHCRSETGSCHGGSGEVFTRVYFDLYRNFFQVQFKLRYCTRHERRPTRKTSLLLIPVIVQANSVLAAHRLRFVA